MKQLSCQELAAWLNDATRTPPLLLDVREAIEFKHCHLANSLHMPMHTVPVRLAELPQDQEIVAICHHGGRSAQVAWFLESRGYSSVYNLSGGVEAWACEIDPSMPRY